MYYSREIDEKETMPYLICSVVAVLKMLIRILNTLRSRTWDMALFLFLCFGSRRTECNSLWGEKGEKPEDFCLLRRYLCQGILFICAHTIIVMFCHFIFCLLAPEGMYSIVSGKEIGRGTEGHGLF